MSKKYPAARAVKFILCEDAREEARQKMSFLGVFPNDSIAIHRAQQPSNGSGVAILENVTIVAMLRGLKGEFTASLKVVSPDEKVLFEAKFPNMKADEIDSALLVAKVKGFVVPAFGKYAVELRLDDRVYPYGFEIVDGGQKPADSTS